MTESRNQPLWLEAGSHPYMKKEGRKRKREGGGRKRKRASEACVRVVVARVSKKVVGKNLKLCKKKCSTKMPFSPI